MHRSISQLFIASLALCALAPAAGAQTRWKSVGKTSSGNEVFVDARSIRRHGDVIDAAVKVAFAKPVAMDGGKVVLERSNAMFNCAAHTTATKDNYLYSNAAGTRLVNRTVNKIPGFGSPFKNTPPDLAMQYVCANSGKKP